MGGRSANLTLTMPFCMVTLLKTSTCLNPQGLLILNIQPMSASSRQLFMDLNMLLELGIMNLNNFFFPKALSMLTLTLLFLFINMVVVYIFLPMLMILSSHGLVLSFSKHSIHNLPLDFHLRILGLYPISLVWRSPLLQLDCFSLNRNTSLIYWFVPTCSMLRLFTLPFPPVSLSLLLMAPSLLMHQSIAPL